MKLAFFPKIILCLLLPGLAGHPAGAQTNGPATLEQISGALRRAHTVCTRFVQERHLSLFNDPLRSEGVLCFQKPGCIRWETTSPYKSILVSDGGGVAQFECSDGRWKKLDLGLGDALQHVISQIVVVMGGGYMDKSGGYAAAVANRAGEVIVTLIPQSQAVRRMMASIEIHLATDLQGTRRVILRENGGDYTEIRFDEQRVNLELPPKTFDRTAPVDLGQIQSAAAGAKP